MSGDDTYYRMSRQMEQTVLADKGLYPNVDFYAATVYHYLGIPTDLFTPVFSVSRMAGWTAHVMEQHADNRLIRPDSEYIGEQNLTWVPSDADPADELCTGTTPSAPGGLAAYALGSFAGEGWDARRDPWGGRAAGGRLKAVGQQAAGLKAALARRGDEQPRRLRTGPEAAAAPGLRRTRPRGPGYFQQAGIAGSGISAGAIDRAALRIAGLPIGGGGGPACVPCTTSISRLRIARRSCHAAPGPGGRSRWRPSCRTRSCWRAWWPGWPGSGRARSRSGRVR